MPGHVRDSVKQIDENSWLIDQEFILRRQTSAPAQFLWKDDDGFWYTHEEVPDPPPAAGPLSPESHVRKVHEAGDSTAVFDFGAAFLQVRDIVRMAKSIPQLESCTREHDTLAWLAERRDRFSFAVPEALYHAYGEGRYYLITSRVPGKTIDEIWRGLDEGEQKYLADRIAGICDEMTSAWTSDAITGVDGRFLAETWLDVFNYPKDISPDALKKNCEKMGMDCSKPFVFFHNDISPQSVMVDKDEQGKISLGLNDWEFVGYVPLEWVRTKLACCWALDFQWPDHPRGHKDGDAWRKLMERTLGEKGYPEVTQAWERMADERRRESQK